MGRLHDAGKPLAGLMIVDEWGFLHEAKRISPETKITARQVWSGSDHTPQGDAISAANHDFNDRIAIYMNFAQGADYYQFQNEWYPKNDNQYFVDYYGELTRLCKREGIHNTIFDFYPGTPEKPSWPILEACIRECWPWAAPNYHGYNPFNSDDMSYLDEWWSLRVLYDQHTIWPADLQNVQWIIGETSNAYGYEGGITLREMQQLHGLYVPFRDHIMYAAWYTLSNPAINNGWQRFNYSDQLPQITDWLVSI